MANEIEFTSIFAPEDADVNNIQQTLKKMQKDIEVNNPRNISSQIATELKKLTRKTYVGDGSTGDANFNGTSAVSGATLSGSTYTLTGDVQYANVIVETGVTVVGRQYLFFVKGTLTNRGTIYANGAWW